MIDNILTNKLQSFQLSAKDLKIDASQLKQLLDEFSTCNLNDVLELKPNSPLELANFVKIWTLVLKRFQRLMSDIQQHNSSQQPQNIDNGHSEEVTVNDVLNKLHTISDQHRTNIESISALNVKLQSRISQLHDSIERLRQRIANKNVDIRVFPVIETNRYVILLAVIKNYFVLTQFVSDFRLVSLNSSTLQSTLTQQRNDSLPKVNFPNFEILVNTVLSLLVVSLSSIYFVLFDTVTTNFSGTKYS
jgi:hypothetical protein